MRSIAFGPSVAAVALTFTSSAFVQSAFLPSTRFGCLQYPVISHSNPLGFSSSFMLSSSTEESSSKSISIRNFSCRDESVLESILDEDNTEQWIGLLPFEEGSHRSARIHIGEVEHDDDIFSRDVFRERLEATIEACREMAKSSLWVDVHMSRAGLIEDMKDLGLRFHHAEGETATLNLWLLDSESKIPEYATHHVGVGAFVLNSKQEVLCVRELRNNYRPWKIPGGLADLGEQIDEAAVREVLEETGIETVFHSILGFRHTHGMANGRSDLYFICRLDPIEEEDKETGDAIIPTPVPQACEIEKAAWVPFSEYREMVTTGEKGGHPMMKQVLKIFDGCDRIEKTLVRSVVPGRLPSPLYHPPIKSSDDTK